MNCDEKIINRLKRSSGQMEGVLRMLDEKRSCEEVLMQLSAVRTGIDRAMALIASENLLDALDVADKRDLPAVQKALDLVMKTR